MSKNESKVSTMKVDLYPPHLNDPEVAKKLSDLLDQRDQCDYESFMHLRDLMHEGIIELGLRVLLKRGDIGEDDLAEDLETINELLRKREQFSNDAMRLICGK